jgi:hypothetical protein
MRSMLLATLLAALAAAACVPGAAVAPADPGGPAPAPAPAPSLPAPPWAAAALPAASVPRVYHEQWAEAENRRSCALIAPADLGIGAGATPRAAQFAGGWAVAYDTPGQRSAFGVAGTGSAASEPRYSDWPRHREWSDGSTVGYGPEGGTGPNQLAYLEIAGQGCLYNVWSRLGVEHLEHLLEQLRFVAPPG